jgi:hypothetical protein
MRSTTGDRDSDENAIGARLSQFIERQRERFDTKQNNTFATGFSEIRIYRGFLAVIMTRYQDASEAIYAHMHQLLESAENGSRALTAAEYELFTDARVWSELLRLETESWYIFAKILLDKVARSIEFYFGPARRLSLDSHDQLVEHFERYATSKQLVVPHEFLLVAAELKKNISDFRDYQIAHHKSPRTVRGMLFDPEGTNARTVHVQLYPTVKDKQVESKALPELTRTVDAYLSRVLDFLELNAGKCKLVPMDVSRK